MAKAKGLTITKKETSQTFDMVELFGRPVPRSIAKEFGNRVEELIIKRSQDGKNIRGDEFTPYSKKYAEEKGVDPGDVDMTLFGDMLGGIKNTAKKDGTVKVEVTGRVNKLKSFNHNTGDTLPKREWFGIKITDPELKKIVTDLKAAVPKPREERPEAERLLEAIEGLELEISPEGLFTGEFFE